MDWHEWSCSNPVDWEWQDAKKSEAMAKLSKDLELVDSNLRLLVEMLEHFAPGVDVPLEENEVVQVRTKLSSL